MKVSLVLTGFMRNWEYNYPMVKEQILDQYNPDVYITSYTYSKNYWINNSEEVDVQKVIDTYNPKNYIFREIETCPEINFIDNGSESIGRNYSILQTYGWYTQKLALNLFNFDDYNIIIKLRTDIGLSNFKIIQSKPLVIPEWKYRPGPCKASQAYVDYFAYGNPKMMKGYFSLYDKLEEMNRMGIDVSLGETLLKNYIDTYVTDEVYKDTEVDWILRGDMWASQLGTIFPLQF
jgi:hypothetical protein